MNLAEVKQFLADNKDSEDVKAYLGELSAVSTDKVKGFLETTEGKQLLQPRLDQYFNTGLNTWKENNLQKLIDEGVRAANPDETPEQKRIRELEEKLENSEKASTRKELVNKALGIADEKKLPKGIIDFFIGDDEDTTVANLNKLGEIYGASLQSEVEAKFKEAGRNVETGGAGGTGNSYGKQMARQSEAHKGLAEAREGFFK